MTVKGKAALLRDLGTIDTVLKAHVTRPDRTVFPGELRKRVRTGETAS